MPESNKILKPIRSFVLRQGRVTDAQRFALENHWPKFGLAYEEKPFDFKAVYKESDQPLVLEIGFGNGHTLAEMASQHPHENYLGIEVHRPGVGSLLIEVDRLELSNVRCIHHDAIEVLNHQIPDASLSRVQLFFPDPWPKRRHHKRRIVQEPFLALIAKKLRKGGVFHMATDWEHYAKEAMSTVLSSGYFKNTQSENEFSPKPEVRPKTRFENRGENLGHGVWDLVFEKNELKHP